MDAALKKILKPVTLALRHLLEGEYDSKDKWKPGDLEQRLASLGVRRDRASRPVDELGKLADEDRHARKVVDAYLKLRQEAGIERADAVAEFVRETAYTWANRLIALRCMEARELIDSVIQQKEAYGGRSLEHHRLAQRHPEMCAGEDDGLFSVLDKVFREQTQRLPMLFDPQAPGIALRPSAAAIKDCFGLLSLNADTLRKYRIRIREDETAEANAELPNPFVAPDALGWTYQYWNTEEKARVFEMVRTVKNAKIAGPDIVPATQLYTEDYMVKFLVQNSLGATWMGMHPDSKLCAGWDYYVRDADRAPVEKKQVREITFLDPACGSGHFLIEAFDLFYAMHEEEGDLTEPADICTAILTQNLFGIDIDERAVQIAEAALWMKAAERSFDYGDAPCNLLATNIRLPRGADHVQAFLEKHPEDYPLRFALPAIFNGLAHADELGSLLKIEEIIKAELAAMRLSDPLFAASQAAEGWLERVLERLRDHFEEAAESSDLAESFFGRSAGKGFKLFDLMSRRYDVVAANPPFMTVYTMGDFLHEWISVAYPDTYYDLFSALLERGALLASNGGCIAFVAQSSFLTIRNYTLLRELLLKSAVPRLVADLGTGAFEDITGAKVNVVLYVGSGNDVSRSARFLDLRDSANKAESLQRGETDGKGYLVIPDSFRQISRSPFIYSMPAGLRRLLATEDSFAQHGQAYLGLKTANNAKFCRMEWEVRNSLCQPQRWKPLVSETNSSPYYLDSFARVSFRDADVTYFRKHVSAQIYNRSLWDRPGLTFGAAAGRGFDVKILDDTSMVLNSSNLALLHDPSTKTFLAGVLNSSLFRFNDKPSARGPNSGLSDQCELGEM